MDDHGRPGAGEVLLRARIRLPTGTHELSVERGGATVVEGPHADAVVHALVDRDPAAEEVELAGTSIRRLDLAARARRGLAVVGTGSVAPDLSVRDHLAAVTTSTRADELLADPPLVAGRGGAPAGVLSGGERRVLGFLRAQALEPVVVVLDRAGAGLDDDVLAWAGRRAASWRRRGIALVVRPTRPEEGGWAAS